MSIPGFVHIILTYEIALVFKLEVIDGRQYIRHFSEQPEYSKEYLIDFNNPVNQKVYVIDDGDYSTMLLAEEY